MKTKDVGKVIDDYKIVTVLVPVQVPIQVQVISQVSVHIHNIIDSFQAFQDDHFTSKTQDIENLVK